MQTVFNQVAYEFEKCRMCVDGSIFSSHTGLFNTCKLCSGRGTIITSHRCACGAPVIMVSTGDHHLYCGNKNCLLNLRADEVEDKRTAEREVQLQHFHSRGYGYNVGPFEGQNRWAE